jgi:integrase
LRTHAASLSDIPIDKVDTDDVIKVLEPIWRKKPETASRLRGRIELVISAAKAKGLRPLNSFNPATWRGHLSILLPHRDRESRSHHEALPYAEAPAFITQLRTRPALAARALEFTILTAARTGETLIASWGEIDLKAGVWTVPASRMKAKTEHRVPLSPAATDLLKRLKPASPKSTDLVFAVEGQPLSNMAMMALLRRMKVEVTVHGFRSTFRDWVGEKTDFPSELAEYALAHQVGGAVERAYRRQTAVERRRELMEAWAAYLATDAIAKAAKEAERKVRNAAEKPAKRRRRRKVDAEAEAMQVKLFDM